MWLALGTKEWNTVLINQIIHPFDADEICKLRIPSNQAKDCVAWHYEKIGVFIVKSAYKLADAIKIQQTKLVSSSTRVVGDRNIWDLIWKSSVPEKIKKLDGELLRNTTPSEEPLSRKICVKFVAMVGKMNIMLSSLVQGEKTLEMP